MRAVFRIARRNVARSRWRSLLVIVLILLPVGGMVGLATVMKTVTPTPERSATHRMGQADLLVYPGQDADDAVLRSKLPRGARVEPILWTGASVVLPGRAVAVSLVSHDPEGLARGMLTLVDGRWPKDGD